QRDELVAGGADRLPRERDRVSPDGPQRTSRHELWHPLPGLLSGIVWLTRRKRSGPFAGARGMRLVRHPVLDRRRGNLYRPGHLPARTRRHAERSSRSQRPTTRLFLTLLGT